MNIVHNFLNRFNFDNNFKSILISSFSSLLAKLTGSFFGLLSGIVIARFYGVEIVGAVSILNSSIAIIALFGGFGLNVALLKLIPNNLENGYMYYVEIKKITFFITLLLSIVLFGVIYLNGLKFLVFQELIPFTIFIFVYLNIGLASLRGFGDVRAYAYFTSIPSIVRFILLTLVTLYYYNRNFPIILVFITPLLTNIWLFIYIRWKYCKSDMPVIKGKLFYRNTLKLAFPLMLTEGMYLLISNVDIIMLGAIKGEAETGVYSVCVTLILLLSMVQASIQSFTTSKFAALSGKEDFEKLKSLALKSSKLNFILHLIPTLVLILFGELILGKLYGGVFIQGYSSLVILSVAVLIRSSCGLVGSILNMTGNERIYSLIIFFIALSNIILNFLLIPIMGMEGAAVSTSISLIAWGVIPAFVVFSKFGFNMAYIPFLKNN